MEKLRMESMDMTKDNVQKIAALFPNCVTEHKDAKGNVVLGIDFEKLQVELGADIIGKNEERYQFTWPDKRLAIREANTSTTSTLRPCKEESVDFDNTKNLYIEGDNLEVLKCLRETYLGKVKMIYIDPPYNTGNDFVYNDDFASDAAEYGENSGQKDEDSNRMVKNTESNGRFHTDWLNMMYPRLKVARDLLSEDGVIFISIDDNEIENLRKICDEVFGNQNLVETLKWKRKKQPSFLAKHTAKVMEYILVYGKNYNSLEKLSIEGTSDSTKKVINISNNESVRIFKSGVRVKVGNSGVIKAGAYTVKTMTVEYLDDVIYENGMTINEVRVKSKFSESQDNINKFIDEGLLFITAQYGLRRDVSEEEKGKRKSITDLLLDWGDNQDSDSEQNLLLGAKLFDYTKPSKLLYNLIKCNFTTDSIILDFFSGSATTAHATLQLNADDKSNRRFILVQIPELTEKDGEAYKAGYKNICEIGKERIRRAGKKIKEEHPEAKDLDTGFRVLKLDSSNMNDVYYTPAETTVDIFNQGNIKSDRTNLDLLFQVMLESNVELSAKIETKTIGGKTVYFVEDNYLVACFDKDVTESVITEIAKEQPYYFVLRDSSMASDNVADNFEQIFRAYSPDTIRKVL